MSRPACRAASVVLTLLLALGLTGAAPALGEVSPAPTPTTAPSGSSAGPTPTASSSAPTRRAPGAQYRPEQGNDWAGTFTILGFFVLASAGLVLVLRKGLASSDAED